VKFAECRLLADENLHSQVVVHLRASGMDVVSVREEGWIGKPDSELLQLAVADDRVIVTHDSDFGTLAIRRGQPLIGILYLRPGHLRPSYTISLIQTVLSQPIDLHPPFIIVAQRSGDDVNIRVREVASRENNDE
jgi:predicted nuclease of predicted toxin-antitoxin system